MQVTVKLHGTLRRRRPATAVGAPHQPFVMELTVGETVQALAQRLGIPPGYVNAAAVNGEAVEAEVILQDGDTVHLFPPSAGG